MADENIFCKDKCPGSESQISTFSFKLSILSVVNFLTSISEIINLILLEDRETAQLVKSWLHEH